MRYSIPAFMAALFCGVMTTPAYALDCTATVQATPVGLACVANPNPNPVGNDNSPCGKGSVAVTTLLTKESALSLLTGDGDNVITVKGVADYDCSCRCEEVLFVGTEYIEHLNELE